MSPPWLDSYQILTLNLWLWLWLLSYNNNYANLLVKDITKFNFDHFDKEPWPKPIVADDSSAWLVVKSMEVALAPLMNTIPSCTKHAHLPKVCLSYQKWLVWVALFGLSGPTLSWAEVKQDSIFSNLNYLKWGALNCIHEARFGGNLNRSALHF